MEFSIKTDSAVAIQTACAIIPIFEGPLRGVAQHFDQGTDGALTRIVNDAQLSGKPGQTLLVPNAPNGAAVRWLLVGAGKHSTFNAKALKTALAAAITVLRDTRIDEATSFLGSTLPAEFDLYYATRISVEATRAAVYRFDELKSRDVKNVALTHLTIALDHETDAEVAQRAVAEGTAIANGTDLAKDLGNRPANICTPSHIAEVAQQLADKHAKLSIRVLTEHDMEELGMGALLAVARGATEPPRLIVLEYRGGAADGKPIALCGKGITFDAGGISLKPPAKMDEMKYDMCGAAGMLGTIAAVAELELPVNVLTLLACSENMPGGAATRPGDIVKSLSGQTVEILNTDAEGRLALCDTLAYAKRFEPRLIIDAATLTGACVVALGHVHAGLFSNDDSIADALVDAGVRSVDSAWHMPSDTEYGDSLKSNFADFANVGSREGGASLAAQFLSRFVDDTPWAHLDIAGVAWHSGSNKGATGRPVPLLVDYLLNIDA